MMVPGKYSDACQLYPASPEGGTPRPAQTDKRKEPSNGKAQDGQYSGSRRRRSTPRGGTRRQTRRRHFKVKDDLALVG